MVKEKGRERKTKIKGKKKQLELLSLFSAALKTFLFCSVESNVYIGVRKVAETFGSLFLWTCFLFSEEVTYFFWIEASHSN